MTTSPRWTDGELLLALEVLDRREWRAGNASTADFVALSHLLRTANLPGVPLLTDSFRSINSVSLKIGNLIGANPHVPGGMRVTPREIAVVADFLNDREGKLAQAVALRARISGGAGDASESTPGNVAERWDEEEQLVAAEGGAEYVLTLRRERSRPLRAAKLRHVEDLGLPIECEACGFDFFEAPWV